MRAVPWLLTLALSCALLATCGGTSSSTCVITTAIIPPNATADHSAAEPGNRVQFSLAYTVKGICPYIADRDGVWSTSDPVNITISNRTPTRGLATCKNATRTAATISNSSTVRGRPFPPASLVCE